MSVDGDSSSDFFEAKYQRSCDPWDFASSPYELGRYESTLAALAHRRFKRAFEPGCSVGVLSERLASICDAVEAIDFSPTAVERARKRCAYLRNVMIVCASFEQHRPDQLCDLIVLSEIGYYFGPEEWSTAVAALLPCLQPGGIVVATHWLGSSADHQISGDQVHAILHASPELRLQHSERHEAFRLDRWARS